MADRSRHAAYSGGDLAENPRVTDGTDATGSVLVGTRCVGVQDLDRQPHRRVLQPSHLACGPVRPVVGLRTHAGNWSQVTAPIAVDRSVTGRGEVTIAMFELLSRVSIF